jgi:uncharacterized protein YjiS (DUF1127 family)
MHATMKTGVISKSWRRTAEPRRTPLALASTWLHRWHTRRDTRQGLAQLDDRLLSDVGITRQQRDAECAKWFWQK